MTAGTRPQPWTLAAGTVAYRGRVRHSLVLGWDVATPTRVTLILGAERGAAREHWVVDRQLLAAGVSGVVEDHGVRVWPARERGDEWVLIRPARGAEPFRVSEERLCRFLNLTDHWVPIGGEVPFEVAVGRLLGEVA